MLFAGAKGIITSWAMDAPLVVSTAPRFSVQDDLNSSSATTAAEQDVQLLRVVQADPDPSP